jgi:acyl dehydratase
MTETTAHQPFTYTFDEIPSLVGREFVGPWLAVDDEHATMFDRSTYYESSEYGWDVTSFPNSMMEGLHLLSLLPVLTNRAARLTDAKAFSVAYGFDRVRFVTPVYHGQNMRARSRVVEVRQKDEGYLTLKHCVIEVEGREPPAYVADVWTFTMPRMRDEFRP